MLQLYMEYIWLIKQWRIYDFPEGDANLPRRGATLLFNIIFEEKTSNISNGKIKFFI